jgi:PKD-like domain
MMLRKVSFPVGVQRDRVLRLLCTVGLIACLLMVCSVSCPQQKQEFTPVTIHVVRADSSTGFIDVRGGVGGLLLGTTGDQVELTLAISGGASDVVWTLPAGMVTSPGRNGNPLQVTLGASGSHVVEVTYNPNHGGYTDTVTATFHISPPAGGGGGGGTPSLSSIGADGPFGHASFDFVGPGHNGPHSVGNIGDTVTFYVVLEPGSSPPTNYEWTFTSNMTIVSGQGTNQVEVHMDSGSPDPLEIYPCVLRTTNAAGASEWQFVLRLNG